jgi:cobalt-zinc-cadmium efflux system outer membrane protein
MKHCFVHGLILTVALSVVPSRVSAGEMSAANMNAVTLEALVAEALEKNPELKFYQAEIIAAQAGRQTAGAFGNPELSGDFGEKKVRGSGFSAEGVVWSVSLAQPFEWPGRMGLRKAIANRDVELAELGLERFRVALTGRMRSLAYGLFASQERRRRRVK